MVILMLASCFALLLAALMVMAEMHNPIPSGPLPIFILGGLGILGIIVSLGLFIWL